MVFYFLETQILMKISRFTGVFIQKQRTRKKQKKKKKQKQKWKEKKERKTQEERSEKNLIDGY